MLWEDKYNPNDYNEDKYSLIPEGDYRVRIENAEEATSHANNNMIKLTLAISGYSSKLWYYLVLNDNSPEEIKKTNKKLGKIFESFGIAEGDFSLDNWKGHVGGARILHEDDANGIKRARVAFFLYRNVVDKLPDWQEKSSLGNIDPDMMDFSDDLIGSTDIPF